MELLRVLCRFEREVSCGIVSGWLCWIVIPHGRSITWSTRARDVRWSQVLDTLYSPGRWIPSVVYETLFSSWYSVAHMSGSWKHMIRQRLGQSVAGAGVSVVAGT